MTETNAKGQMVSEFNEDYTMEEKYEVFEEAISSESLIQAEYDKNGNKKEETINDEWYEEGSDLTITEEFIDEEEITYDEDVCHLQPTPTKPPSRRVPSQSYPPTRGRPWVKICTWLWISFETIANSVDS